MAQARLRIYVFMVLKYYIHQKPRLIRGCEANLSCVVKYLNLYLTSNQYLHFVPLSRDPKNENNVQRLFVVSSIPTPPMISATR
jgi:hypothetical protein